MFLITLLLGSIGIFSVYLVKKHFRQLQLTWNFPGPSGLPLIGNGLDLIYKTPLGMIERSDMRKRVINCLFQSSLKLSEVI
jgi:hypothetical protein